MMNDVEREFWITKVDKYVETINQIEGDIPFKVFKAGLGVAIALASTAITGFRPDNIFLTIPVIFASSCCAVGEIKDVLTEVAIKAGLTDRLEEIEEKLELDSLEQGEGRGI